MIEIAGRNYKVDFTDENTTLMSTPIPLGVLAQGQDAVSNWAGSRIKEVSDELGLDDYHIVYFGGPFITIQLS